LLDNGSVSTFPLQRIDGVIYELFEMVGYIQFASKLQKEISVQFKRVSRVEAGSNTSTVALRVVEGDEKGSLESDTVKYGHERHGTRIRE
jgi:hypothetical protein